LLYGSRMQDVALQRLIRYGEPNKSIIQFTTPEQETRKIVMEAGSTIAFYTKGEVVKMVSYRYNLCPDAADRCSIGCLLLPG
jgi:hypothetical protein